MRRSRGTVLVRCVTRSSRGPEELWTRALDVERHASSLADWGERVEETSAPPGEPLGIGDQATFSAWHLGMRWWLTTRVVAGERPRWFRDEQVAGPFASWHHDHRFEPEGSGTRLVDEVRYRAPLAARLVGIDRWWLRRRVAELLCRRALDVAGEPQGHVEVEVRKVDPEEPRPTV